MANVEVLYYDGYKLLYALKDFHQGEVIDLPPEIVNSMYSVINHSCEPNAAVRKGRIIAWTCIKAEDEITLDYMNIESKTITPFDCDCGSKKCRGRIK